jgi:hypothetical protein
MLCLSMKLIGGENIPALQGVHLFADVWHSWALSPLSVSSDIGLCLYWNILTIGLKGSQAYISSNIRLTFLVISDVQYLTNLCIRG